MLSFFISCNWQNMTKQLARSQSKLSQAQSIRAIVVQSSGLSPSVLVICVCELHAVFLANKVEVMRRHSHVSAYMYVIICLMGHMVAAKLNRGQTTTTKRFFQS